MKAADYLGHGTKLSVQQITEPLDNRESGSDMEMGVECPSLLGSLGIWGIVVMVNGQAVCLSGG